MRGMRAACAAVLMGLTMIGLAAAPPGRTADLQEPQLDQAAPTIPRAVGPGLVTGRDAQAAFEALRRGGLVAFTDFEDVPTGTHGRLKLGGPAEDIAVRLRTTMYRWPLPERRARAGTPVVVLPHDFVTSPANHRLMGVIDGGIPDGQSRYELVFSPPVSHVGLLRMWNPDSLTRFYNEAGTLLAGHQNTTHQEFVGYVAVGPEDRVRRIVLDGIASDPDSKTNKAYQVGEVDDLYVGDPSSEARAAAALPGPAGVDTSAAQPPDPRQDATGGGVSYDALVGLPSDAEGPPADRASQGDGATEADPGAAPGAPAATEERPGVPPAGNASGAGSAAKAPHPLFELMAMLILSEAQRGETTEQRQAIATGAARDLITFLQHLGVLKAGVSGDLTENDLLQAIEALRPEALPLPSQEPH